MKLKIITEINLPMLCLKTIEEAIARNDLESVCVDLDGLLAKYDHWRGIDHIGDPIKGAQEFLEKLSQIANIIILTARSSSGKRAITKVREWLKDNKMKYNQIWTKKGKPVAAAYIDDRGIRCLPQHNSDAYNDALKTIKRVLKK